jgi:hypothetical protein
MARYHGKDAVVYMSVNEAGDASEVKGMNSWDLDMSTDTVDVTAFGDKNKVFVQGLPNLSGTFSGFWDDTEDKIRQARKSATPVKLYLYQSRNAASKYHYGKAWIGAAQTAGVGDAVTQTVNFTAADSWDEK